MPALTGRHISPLWLIIMLVFLYLLPSEVPAAVKPITGTLIALLNPKTKSISKPITILAEQLRLGIVIALIILVLAVETQSPLLRNLSLSLSYR